MKMTKIPMVTDNHIKQFMLKHIKAAYDMAILQCEVDHLKMMYTKYHDTTPSEQERFEDIAYCDKLLK